MTLYSLSLRRREIFLALPLLAALCLAVFSKSGIHTPVKSSTNRSTLSFLATGGSTENGHNIFGQVTDLQGGPQVGLFVSARNQATGCTTYVLSQAQGQFQIRNLPPGKYNLMVEARGWESQPQRFELTSSTPPPVTLKVKPSDIYVSQLTSSEILTRLPDGEGKQVLLSNCTGCHTLQKMVAGQWNTLAWRKIMGDMRTTFGAQIPDGKEELLIEYCSSAFAPKSQLHHAAEQMPVPQTKPMDVTYAAWDIPLQKALPHTATYDAQGNIWFTDAFGSRIGNLDVTTGKFKTWNAPTPNSIPHGIVVDKNGKVWFTERLHLDPANKIVKFDPLSESFTEYSLPQKKSGPHTLKFDQNGILWISEYEGNRIARFDPETGRFTEYDVPTKDAKPYGIDIDKNGVIWIAEIGSGSLGKLDPKIGKVIDYPTPTKDSGVRRVRVDSKERVWFTEFLGDRLGMFDPKTEKMTEYVMPGIRPQPYALEVTKDDKIWLSTWHQDVMMKFDPTTKTFTSYPVPFLDLEIRDFRIDKDDTLWFVAMIPNKVVSMKAR